MTDAPLRRKALASVTFALVKTSASKVQHLEKITCLLGFIDMKLLITCLQWIFLKQTLGRWKENSPSFAQNPKIGEFEDIQDNQIGVVFFLHWMPMDRVAALYLSNVKKKIQSHSLRLTVLYNAYCVSLHLVVALVDFNFFLF